MPPESAISKYNPHLDGLRGIAIIMVICYHYFTGFYIGDIGWAGVDLFFFLSGYLLTGRLLPYLADKKLLLKFYANRLLRIVPLYFLFLILFYLLAAVFTSPETYQSLSPFRQHAAGIFFFAINWLFNLNLIPTAYLGHFWSLAVEEQLYLIFPWIILLVRNTKKLLVIGISLLPLILVTRCIYFFMLNEDDILVIYRNTFFRADAFLSGFVLYLLLERGKYISVKYMRLSMLVSCAAIIAGGIYSGSFRMGPFFLTIGFTFVNIINAGLVLFTTTEKKNIIQKITEWHPLRFTGKISFGLYVFHWPVYQITLFSITHFTVKYHVSPPRGTVYICTLLISFILSYLISHLSFKYYESFFLKHKLKPVRNPAPLAKNI